MLHGANLTSNKLYISVPCNSGLRETQGSHLQKVPWTGLKKNPYVCLLLRKNAKSRVLFKIRFFK